ncbi:uncharacterized protein N7469_009641 [Penicillium citrinum]|uniref:Trafficking protein particle complex subunit n=1 Tax=Penicillium citrinum TaxID=5077 RepID=A0A9W9NIR8_PENCI|nr:uncharacterized protein N7469_009641 [Penicillium citrinum]KAJ5220754.1 hypothetical protein N7469_009641 [Penicillium citrinum]
MPVYSFYIFDRHAECIYKRRWLPRPTSIAGKSSRATDPQAGPTGLGQTVKAGDDDAKLVFGTVFSLRNMVRKLGGEEDNFVSYSTSQYKLHYYETPTNIKFVMLTDLKSPSMRIALQQIYINLFVEYEFLRDMKQKSPNEDWIYNSHYVHQIDHSRAHTWSNRHYTVTPRLLVHGSTGPNDPGLLIYRHFSRAPLTGAVRPRGGSVR